MGEVTINFIAFDEARDACLMVLVEEDWRGPTESHLRALQDRLYGCLDAVFEGQLAKQFPKSIGKTVIVRIDCYDLPRAEIDEFVQRFAAGVLTLPDYAVDVTPYAREIRFEVDHDSLSPSH